MLILNVMVATEEKSMDEQQKAGRVSCTKRKQLEEHFRLTEINWHRVSNMTGYKKWMDGFNLQKAVYTL